MRSAFWETYTLSVADRGGPCEVVIQGKTGLVCKADNSGIFLAAMKSLVRNPDRRVQMGIESRKYAETRSFENAFLKLWDLYQEQTLVRPRSQAAG